MARRHGTPSHNLRTAFLRFWQSIRESSGEGSVPLTRHCMRQDRAHIGARKAADIRVAVSTLHQNA
jgi:hypothetical protein